MADVKWIKITTSIFDDEKIKVIDSLPERDAIFVIWIKLLTLAGKCNGGGLVYLSETVPYTDEMLAAIFNRPVNVVRLALDIFRRFGMIDIFQDQKILIINWGKHQNIAGLEKIRIDTAARVSKYRERKRLEACNVTVTKCNDTESESESESDKEYLRKDTLSGSADETPTSHIKKDENTEEAHKILDYLNAESGKHFRYTATNIRPIKARMKEGFTFDDFKLVIDYKANTWGRDPKMSEYVRPLTLFGTKFESYREEVR